MHSDKGALVYCFMKACNITKLHIVTVLVLLSFCVGTLKCLIITPCGLLDRGRWSCIKQETVKKGGEEIQSPREACQSRTSSWRTVSSIKSAWWVCVPPVRGLFISWLRCWGYGTLSPIPQPCRFQFWSLGYDAVCSLSHDFRFQLRSQGFGTL
jgi:hypothetical protein